MKKYLYYSIFTLVSALLCCGAVERTNVWGTATNSVKMSISLTMPGVTIASNEAVELEILVANVSTNQSYWLTFFWAPIEADGLFSFVVVTPSGKTIPIQVDVDWDLSTADYELGPSNSKPVKYNMSKVYKFDEIGNYTIIAKRQVGLPIVVERGVSVQRSFTVVSNPLSIRVVP